MPQWPLRRLYADTRAGLPYRAVYWEDALVNDWVLWPVIPTQATAPLYPMDGCLWIDSSVGPPYQLRVFAGGSWQPVA